MSKRRVGPATEGRMGDLHSKLCDLLIDMLDGEVITEVNPVTEQEEEVTLDPSPQVLNVARAFLKDNDIRAAVEENEDLSSLQHKLKQRQKEAKGRRFADINVVPITGTDT